MITNLEIQVQSRKTGKSNCRKLRRAESVPGVVYGAGKKNTSLLAEEKIVKKFASHEFENAIFTLKSDDKEVNGTKVLFKEVTRHPVNRRPIHFDFLAIDLNKEIRVYVELKFEGKAIGLSEGGLLEPIVRQLEVACLPSKIPEYIAVNVSELHVGQTVHLKEITLPEGVRAVSQDDLALVTVTVVKEEELTPTPAAAAAGDAAAAAAAPGAAAPAAGAAAAPGAAAPAADAKKAEKK
jgi:large subunit ribosomal protein L25